MTEIELRALRDSLQESANPPAFEVIAGRRHRRTRRWASMGVACLTVAVFAGATWGLRERGQAEQPVAPRQSKAISVSAHGSGTLFALDAESQLVKLSKDGGRTWHAMNSGMHDSGSLAAASADSTWVVADGRVSYISPNKLEVWPVTDPGAFSVAGERLWLVSQGKMMIWTSLQGPVQTSPLPAPVKRVAALSTEAAMVMTLDKNEVATWYYTSDSGAHWSTRPDPCDAAPTSSNLLASNSFTTVFAAPDRSLWTVCASETAAGQQPKALLVSTDDGETWQSRGLLESPGYATIVNPVSATAAWRTGGHSDLYRTVDGTQWETVISGNGNGFELAATDQNTAIRLDLGQGEYPLAHLTRDGGRTWTPVMF